MLVGHSTFIRSIQIYSKGWGLWCCHCLENSIPVLVTSTFIDQHLFIFCFRFYCAFRTVFFSSSVAPEIHDWNGLCASLCMSLNRIHYTGFLIGYSINSCLLVWLINSGSVRLVYLYVFFYFFFCKRKKIVVIANIPKMMMMCVCACFCTILAFRLPFSYLLYPNEMVHYILVNWIRWIFFFYILLNIYLKKNENENREWMCYSWPGEHFNQQYPFSFLMNI